MTSSVAAPGDTDPSDATVTASFAALFTLLTAVFSQFLSTSPSVNLSHVVDDRIHMLHQIFTV